MVILFVEKKDGRIESFDIEKIKRGLFKAVKEAGGDNKEKSDSIATKVVDYLNEKFWDTNKIKYSDILDAIELILVKGGHDKVSRAFILFRYRDQMLRSPDAIGIDNNLIKKYLNETDWAVKENANMAYSLQGLNYSLSSKISSNYWLTEVYPNNIAKAHVDADFHIHDLSVLGPYCMGHDLLQLITTGFNGVSGKIHCTPPKHFRSVLGQAVNYTYTVSGECAGAQAFSNFDTLLAPYIKKDNLLRDEVKQALQEYLYNMNVPTRVGFQSVFSNITLDVTCPVKLKDKPAFIGNTLADFTYGDCQPEINMFNEVFCELMIKGDGQERLFSFPIPTYNITKEFDWENPVNTKIFEMTAKYGIPYFSNYINSDMSADDATSMCCRLRINHEHLTHRGGGLFGSAPKTGSIGVVTINLPRIGYNSKTEEEYFKKLDDLMDLAKESLIIKTKFIEQMTENGFYPYLKHYLAGIKEDTGRYWSNHFLTIGLLGMNESLINFGKPPLTTQEGVDFAEKILIHMRNKITKYQIESGYLFNLESTPGESTGFRFARADKERYPDIIIANEKNFKEKKAAPYYSNSSQMPVDSKLDLFTTLKLQEPLQTKYTGGTTLHVFLGEKLPSAIAVKNLIKKLCENYSIPYYSLTPTFSICPNHGYIKGAHTYCPECLEPGDIVPTKDL
jgi:ribonucleoside-triphosphate reductase